MPQIAFLFPGQGAQAIGMGRQLCETVPAARRLFDEAAEVLGYDLAAVCTEGPAERLNSTVVSQPAIFVSSLAALEAMKVCGGDQLPRRAERGPEARRGHASRLGCQPQRHGCCAWS
jgi:[acyl-carrier-protein] S-malonyltransferase